jgi:hypothetical protein
MALATLCSAYLKQDYKTLTDRAPRFAAFVVDHQLRDGSAEEAQTVAGHLHSLGTMPLAE